MCILTGDGKYVFIPGVDIALRIKSVPEHVTS